MQNLIDRLTDRQFVSAALVTLATLIVLNGVLVSAARQVSARLVSLVPLLAALISYIVGVAVVSRTRKAA